MSGGLNAGSTQALRSAIEPSYLGTGDPGMAGGGTARSNDTEAMMQAYENVFGPAARDIKFDTQRQKRHQRWHLPDVLKGSSAFLTDRVDVLITDATSSPFTKTILPYMYMERRLMVVPASTFSLVASSMNPTGATIWVFVSAFSTDTTPPKWSTWEWV